MIQVLEITEVVIIPKAETIKTIIRNLIKGGVIAENESEMFTEIFSEYEPENLLRTLVESHIVANP